MRVECPCGTSYEVTYDGPTIKWCPSCATGVTVPPPDRDVHGDGLFEDANAGYGGRRLQDRDQWFYEAQLRLAWIGRRLGPGATLLEVGAATGEFVAVAERAGFDVTGLETSPGAAAAAADLTARVLHEDLHRWRLRHADTRVDAGAMFHVLEHFADPRAFLSELRAVLQPGGLLFIEVPNGAAMDARRYKLEWWAARPEDHYFHFTPAGLSAALAGTGFDVTEMRAIHRDTYVNLGVKELATKAAKDFGKLMLGRGGRSLDLLRAVAVAKSQ